MQMQRAQKANRCRNRCCHCRTPIRCLVAVLVIRSVIVIARSVRLRTSLAKSLSPSGRGQRNGWYEIDKIDIISYTSLLAYNAYSSIYFYLFYLFIYYEYRA